MEENGLGPSRQEISINRLFSIYDYHPLMHMIPIYLENLDKKVDYIEYDYINAHLTGLLSRADRQAIDFAVLSQLIADHRSMAKVVEYILYMMAPTCFVSCNNPDIMYTYSSRDGTWHMNNSDSVIRNYLLGNIRHSLDKLDGFDRIVDKLVTPSPQFIKSIRAILTCKLFTKKILEDREYACVNGAIINLRELTWRSPISIDLAVPFTDISISNLNVPYMIPSHISDEPAFKFLDSCLGYEGAKSFIEVLCTVFSGMNILKKAIIFEGPTNGGKSTISHLIEATFPLWCKCVPLSLLTKASPAQGATSPELAMMNGTRIPIFNEPSERAKIDGGIFKTITGGDLATARNPYENFSTFKLIAIPIVLCNSLSAFTTNDPAVLERIFVFRFNRMYLREELYNRIKSIDESANVGIMDPNMQDTIKSYAPSLLKCLIKRYNKYMRTGNLRLYSSYMNSVEDAKVEMSPMIEYIRSKYKPNPGYTVKLLDMATMISFSNGRSGGMVSVEWLRSALILEGYACNHDTAFNISLK